MDRLKVSEAAIGGRCGIERYGLDPGICVFSQVTGYKRFANLHWENFRNSDREWLLPSRAEAGANWWNNRVAEKIELQPFII